MIRKRVPLPFRAPKSSQTSSAYHRPQYYINLPQLDQLPGDEIMGLSNPVPSQSLDKVFGGQLALDLSRWIATEPA